jgi:hypothetical protein
MSFTRKRSHPRQPSASMSISHTARVTLNVSSDDLDLEAWPFGLSDADYQACAKGHRGAGVSTDEQGRGMINVESIGGNLIVQHYRSVRADRGYVEMYSPASRIYLFHLVPVAGAVRWTLEVTPKGDMASDFACTVEVQLGPILGLLARLSFLDYFLARHVDEEARGFAADITHKQLEGSNDLQADRQEPNPSVLRSSQ